MANAALQNDPEVVLAAVQVPEVGVEPASEWQVLMGERPSLAVPGG